MKAIIFHEYGGVDKLEYEEVPTPNLQQGEVLVKVKAAALNHLDIWERMGGVPLPHISGSDISGEVVKLSNDAIGLDIGDKVVVFPVLTCGKCQSCLTKKFDQCSQRQIIGYQIDGGYAEYVKVPASNLIPIPSNLSFEEAAALPVAGSTAWHMLVNKGKVNATSTVLIHGSSSGVSIFAIQITKIFGAKAIVTAGSNEKVDKALKLGADHAVNYKEKNVVEEVKRITNGRGVDIVLDHVGEATFNIGLESLKYGGRMISAGVTTGKEIHFNIQYLYRNELIIEGSYIFTMNEFFHVLKMAEEGRLKSIISDVFPLKDAAKAQSVMENSRYFGKLLLKI
jgi:NADPH:quinone reductase-like Zn-dependent oxidoreductase